jgi:hypothetical protein
LYRIDLLILHYSIRKILYDLVYKWSLSDIIILINKVVAIMGKVINFEEQLKLRKYANMPVTKEDRLKAREELFYKDYDFPKVTKKDFLKEM